MTDDRARPDPADRNGVSADPVDPLAGMSIDFGADAGAAGAAAMPLGGAAGTSGGGVAPIAFATESAPAMPATGGPAGRDDGAGRTESKVVIVGSGPAGLTAAIYAARANLEPIVLAGSAAGGQLMLTSDVENYPGFPEGIQGPDLMTRFREQAARFGTHIVDVDVEQVDFSAPTVPALGPRGRVPRRVGDHRDRRVGDLARPRRARPACAAAASAPAQRATGSSSGTRRSRSSAAATPPSRRRRSSPASPRRSTSSTGATSSAASKIMVDRATDNPKIEIHLNTAVEEVLGDGHVEGLRLRRHRARAPSGRWPTRACSSRSATSPTARSSATGSRSTRRATSWSTTRPPPRSTGVFVAGDVHDHRYRQAVTAAGDGCRAAIDAERWLEAEGITEASTATAW